MATGRRRCSRRCLGRLTMSHRRALSLLAVRRQARRTRIAKQARDAETISYKATEPTAMKPMARATNRSYQCMFVVEITEAHPSAKTPACQASCQTQ